jgi:hypothetical protein
MCLHVDGLLATYSCAAAVRTALLAADLQIGSTPPVGRRSPGTVAAHTRGGGRGQGAGGRGQGAGGVCLLVFLVFPISLVSPLPLVSPIPPSPPLLHPFPGRKRTFAFMSAAIPYRDPQVARSR